MNWIQKFLTKQFTSVINNQFLSSVFRYWGYNTPIWYEDSPEVYINEGYQANADVYSVVKRIIDLGAVIPWKVQKKQGGKWVDVLDHELQLLIENPNPMQSQNDFFSAIMGYYLLTGDAFMFAPFLENGMNKGKTKELWPMASHVTNIKFGNINNPILGYYITSQPEDIIDPANICHIKTWNPDSNGWAFRGQSPLMAGARNVKLGNTAVTAEVKSFDNLGPDGILSREGAGGEGSSFTPEQASTLQQRWDGRYTGVENIKKVVMTGATVKWQQMGLSPVDLNILESKKYNMATICNLYGAPVQLFNNTDKTAFNNMDSAHKQMYLHAVLPVLYAIRDGLNRWLTPRWGKDIWLTPDISGIEVLQANKKEQVEWLEKAWWIKGTEKQRIMGIEEDKEMDKYFIPGTLVPSDQLGETEDDLDSDLKKLLKVGVKDYE
jgi:HK97 family phage portal protein